MQEQQEVQPKFQAFKKKNLLLEKLLLYLPLFSGVCLWNVCFFCVKDSDLVFSKPTMVCSFFPKHWKLFAG